MTVADEQVISLIGDVVADNDAASILVSSTNQDSLSFTYQAVGGEEEESGAFPTRLGTQTADGHYLYNWIPTGLQRSIPTEYVGRVMAGGEVVLTVNWTQPPLITDPNDIVLFPDIMKSRISKVIALAEKFALQGYATHDEYTAFQAMVYLTSYFNTIKWEDGR